MNREKIRAGSWSGRRLSRWAAWCVFLLGPQLGVPAATVTIEHVEPVAFPELLVRADQTTLRGYREVIREPGKLYVALWIQANIFWDAASSKLHIPEDQIRLRAYDGTETRPIGRMERYGVFSDQSQAFGRFRPVDWKKRPNESVVLNAVFAVPKSRAKFKLLLGDAAADFKVPAHQASLNPASYVDFDLIEAAYLAELPVDARSNGKTLESLCERFLAITFTVRPRRSNGGPRRSFELETDWFSLRDVQGGIYSPLGESVGGVWAASREHEIPAVGPKRWDRVKFTLFFAAGTVDREYDLMFLGFPVLNTGHQPSGGRSPGNPGSLKGRPLKRR